MHSVTVILPWALLIGGIKAQSINQTPASETVLLGASVLLQCTYKVSGTPYPAWYVQYPGEAPTLLIHYLTQKHYKGFSAEHDTGKSSYHLRKDRADLSDSGVYLCAVGDTVTELYSSPVT